MTPVLDLQHDRTLAVNEAGDVVEVRAADGAIEVRVRMTADGPVLEMTAVKLVLAAQESVQIAAPDVRIDAANEIDLNAAGDVRVTGETIWLN